MTTNRHLFPAAALLTALLLGACADEAPDAANMPDAAAIEANNLAVGLMGRFEYAEAEARFAELAADWPGWHDVRINLAVATLNRQQEGDEQRALALAREVLATEPGHLRARYVAGLVQLYRGETADALEAFRTVAEGDPGDAHAAYFTAQCLAQLGEHEQALAWYEQAMALDPYLRSAYYGAFQTLQRLRRPNEAAVLAEIYRRLENNPRSHLTEFKYTRMGPKADTLATDLAEPARPPARSGALFAEPVPLSISATGVLSWASRPADRPATITTADLQNDGLPDLFLSGVRDTGNLVLLGEEDGTYRAVPDHPLAAVSDVNAALWGDFDNDGLVDAYLCRRGHNQLWRQSGPGDWQDVTASTLTAGADLDTVDGAFFDADHDGDLDLFLVNTDGPNELLNNNLDGTFRSLAAGQGLAGGDRSSLMVLPADLDNDRDVDLVVLNNEPPHEVYLNDRLWSYHPADGFDEFNNFGARAVLAADLEADGQTELFTITEAGAVLRWRADAVGVRRPEVLAQPAVLQDAAHVRLALQDVDGNGVPDLIVASEKGWGVLAISPGGASMLTRFDALPDTPLLASLPMVAGSAAGPAILALSGAAGPVLWPPGPGRHPFVTLSFSGRQDDAQSMRSNASGIGTQVAVRTGSNWSLLQNYRSHSAPGQSLQPLAVGLGGARQADFIAIDWSDGVFQSEVSVSTGALQNISETQRQLSSCPVLFAWDGQKYAFVSDILGVGGMGYAIGPGQYSTPRPWENFLLPEGLLLPKDGRYHLKVAEPMEENAYLDAAQLSVYDLPPGWGMVMDERMGISEPLPTGRPLFFRHEALPTRVTNDRGRDVLAQVTRLDGAAAPVGRLDARFIGRLIEEHRLRLEFDQPLDLQAGTPVLIADGWVEYPYSQTNFAAWQAGAAFDPPTLEALVDDQWEVVYGNFGYPAGMPRRMALPLPDLPPGTRILRLRSNMQVYWDRVAIAWAEDPPRYEKQQLTLVAARQSKPGFARRSTLAQFRPHYDYQDSNPFWDTRYMSGSYTRFGPVDELVGTVDDAVAIIGPGEEVHLEFSAPGPAPAGWTRHLVLEAKGWAKDMDLFTRDGETVGPLPSTGKPAAPRERLHAKYHTRYQGGR